MSKRAEAAAMEALPDYSPDGKTKVDLTLDRLLYQHGYEQAERDFIDLAQLWVDSGDANVMSFQQFLKCHETQGNK